MDLSNIKFEENNDFVEIDFNQNTYLLNKIKKKNILIKKCLSLLQKQDFEFQTLKQENDELNDINKKLLNIIKNN